MAQKKPETGFTSVNGNPKHSHAFRIDAFGNGSTSGLIGSGAPHEHHIIQRKVKPSGMDSHVHELIMDRHSSHSKKEPDPLE